MCVNPISIKNPRIKGGTFDNMYHPVYLTVPCGHCYECLLKKQNDWYVRNFYEWKNSKENKSNAYYYTLTYNDHNLLRVYGVCSRIGVRLFDKEKVKHFLRRLGSRLNRRGIKLKYFLVSELGSKYERPHHHVIFYPSVFISPGTFKSFVSETWTYGFVKEGSNFGVINSSTAISYVCKYLTKGSKFTKISSPTKVPSFCRLAKYLTRNFGEFTLNSSGLGKLGISQLNDSNITSSKLSIPVDGKYKECVIPIYYLRKLIYDEFKNDKGNICFKLNNRGFNLLKERFNYVFDSIEKRCAFYNSSHQGASLTPDLILHCQLCPSMSERRYKGDLFGLYYHRFKLGKENYVNPYEIRYDLDRDTKVLYSSFLLFNQSESYRNYSKRVDDYNVRQRVLYKRPKLLNKINKQQYVGTFNELAVGRKDYKVSYISSAFDIRDNSRNYYTHKRKLKLCDLINVHSVRSLFHQRKECPY